MAERTLNALWSGYEIKSNNGEVRIKTIYEIRGIKPVTVEYDHGTWIACAENGIIATTDVEWIHD